MTVRSIAYRALQPRCSGFSLLPFPRVLHRLPLNIMTIMTTTDDHDFHFRDEDRGHFAPHYQKDINHWQHNSHGRPHFERGQRIPPQLPLPARASRLLLPRSLRLRPAISTATMTATS